MCDVSDIGVSERDGNGCNCGRSGDGGRGEGRQYVKLNYIWNRTKYTKKRAPENSVLRD